jgi:hypothetical protein
VATEHRKSPLLAAALQGVPLVAAGGCVANAANDQESGGLALLLGITLLWWGLGYLYLGKVTRFGVAVAVGPVLAFAACSASFSTSEYYDKPFFNPYEEEHVASANRASLVTAGAITVMVLVLMLDAMVLADEHNQRIDTKTLRDP